MGGPILCQYFCLIFFLSASVRSDSVYTANGNGGKGSGPLGPDSIEQLLEGGKLGIGAPWGYGGFPVDSPYTNLFVKRGDKRIMLDVGDYVMNGGPGGANSGAGGIMDEEPAVKSFLVKNPSTVFRLRGMMRNAG